MNIVAVSAEPEFIRLEATEGGGIDLTVEIARMQCTDTANLTSGSVQLHLLPADVDVMTEQLATIVSGLGFSIDRVKQQHSVAVRPAPGTFPDDEQDDPCDCGTVRGESGGYLPHAIGGHPDCTGADDDRAALDLRREERERLYGPNAVTQYEWTVKFRNDRMGFVKTKHLQASTSLEATSLAFFELTSDGYENADFSVTECVRGREVNT